MFCGRCGSQVEDSAEFCPNCGMNFAIDEQAKNQSDSYSPNSNIPNTPNIPNMPNPMPYNPAPILQKTKGERWCNFFIGFLKVMMVLEILSSVISGIVIIFGGASFDYYYDSSFSIIIGIVVIVAGILLSFLSNSLFMIFAYAAKDIALIRKKLDMMN